MALRDFTKPDEESPARAAGIVAKDSIIRAYDAMRLATGILGTTWPIILIVFDIWFLSSSPRARGSISAYYYSGMREWFVGVLFAIAPMLITYKLFEKNRDNLLSTIAGIAGIVVAVFPTGRPSDDIKLTAIQQQLGETWVQRIHFGAAAIFVVCLALICVEFARRERLRPRVRISGTARFSPETWALFHMTMVIIIFIAIGFIIVTKLADVLGHYRLLIGESLICIAFGLSWLTKGSERDVLIGLPAAEVPDAVARMQRQRAVG